jgi:hypothetical protein
MTARWYQVVGRVGVGEVEEEVAERAGGFVEEALGQ